DGLCEDNVRLNPNFRPSLAIFSNDSVQSWEAEISSELSLYRFMKLCASSITITVGNNWSCVLLYRWSDSKTTLEITETKRCVISEGTRDRSIIEIPFIVLSSQFSNDTSLSSAIILFILVSDS